MNTPRTVKPPPRYTPAKVPRNLGPDASSWGIKDPSLAAAFGWMISYWPHLEQKMIEFFEELLTGRQSNLDSGLIWSSREIFRSITSQGMRIDIMKGLLHRTPHNAGKGDIYDEIIDEFEALNKIRNEYVHGLWRWSDSENKLYLTTHKSADLVQNSESRAIDINTLHSDFDRMRSLWAKLDKRRELWK